VAIGILATATTAIVPQLLFGYEEAYEEGEIRKGDRVFEVRWFSGWFSDRLSVLRSHDRARVGPDQIDWFLPHWLLNEPLGTEDFANQYCGWPWRCAWCQIHQDIYGDPDTVKGGFKVRARGSSPAPVIPYRPIWRGMALDTMLWAAAAMLTARCVGSVKRTRRRLAGLCTSCGYDLERVTGGVCPECGHRFDRAG
jgi:hypothetical protein